MSKKIKKRDRAKELFLYSGFRPQQGNELTAEEVCKDGFDSGPDLTKVTNDIKATDRMEEGDNMGDDFMGLPDASTLPASSDETYLPESKLNVDEFCKRLIDSELMNANEVKRLRKRISADDAGSFAEQLIYETKLTPFQAKILMDSSPTPLVLDRYVLLEEIGRGGMGAVYKALHQQMDRIVALKILPKDAVDSPEKVNRFHREVKTAAKLEHPNIVTAFDASEDKGIHFLVMSYIDGNDLSQLIRSQGPLPMSKTLDCIAQAARGLEYAHQLGIVHRDIKPANLILNRQGRVKILDMGLARIERQTTENDNALNSELTKSGMVMGTIAYLAPEQAMDTRNADARSDIYSLGCTLYHLLTGKVPYMENTFLKTILAHREGAIPSLRDVREGGTAELDGVFKKMVAKQPKDRFQSMSEVIFALDELGATDEKRAQPVVAGSQAYHDTPTVIDTSRDVLVSAAAGSEPPKRRRGVAAAGMFGLMLLLAGLIVMLQTPAGTIIIEVDQPELMGAVVTIDGEKKITLQSGMGKEPIEITPDDKRHLLEVKIAGYKTYSKEFSFETGNKQTIKVRLEPLNELVEAKAPKRHPVVAASPEETPAERWVLEFDGKGNYVEIPSLKIDASEPLVFEAWCSISPGKNLTEDNLDPLFITNTLTRQSTGNVLIYTRGKNGYWMASQVLSGETAVSTQLYKNNGIQEGQVHHVASVWNGSEHGLYYNGVLVERRGTTLPPVYTDIEDGDLPPSIGTVRLLHSMNQRYLQGIISQVRISNVPRYTEDFVPNKRFENDDHTLVLYHFEEGQGDVLTDSSGNLHHGKIVGAKWTKVDEAFRAIGETQAVTEPTPYDSKQPNAGLPVVTGKPAENSKRERADTDNSKNSENGLDDR